MQSTKKNIILNKFFDIITRFVNKYGMYYLSVKKLPKLNGNVDVIVHDNIKIQSEDVAIIIQGPIKCEENFTLNTVKLYKKIFSNSEIIVSTWTDQDQIQLKLLRELGVTVVESSPLDNRGSGNVNAQLLSSLKGFNSIKGDQIKYVLKTRSDQRIYYPGTLGYLKGLLNILDNKDGNNRIICVDNISNCLDRLPPFYIIDYLYFGEKNQIERLLNIPFNECEYKDGFDLMKKLQLSSLPDAYEQCKYNIPPEYYITVMYLKSLGENGNFFDYEYFYECLKKYFIQISTQDIDLYWPKYYAKYNQPVSILKKDENVFHQTENMNFQNYVNIINDFK
ncbi:MAG: WavE lipopolysaccharide synthesis family protein [Eubacteriales bacterium]|nr:WavE lipopolysaccharide synthesis family protein [Eubacteriales bacterium]